MAIVAYLSAFLLGSRTAAPRVAEAPVLEGPGPGPLVTELL